MSNIRKLIPCSVHDIAKLEQWIGDMAKEGLRLKKIRSDIAVFEQSEQNDLKYYLIISDNVVPDATYIAEMESLGWQYVLKYGKILYFVTEDMLAFEPERDYLHIIQQVKKVKRKTFVISLGLMVVTYMMLFTLPMNSIIRLGSGKILFITILYVLFIIKHLCDETKLAWWTKLVQEDNLDIVEIDWRNGSFSNKCASAILVMFSIFIFVGGFVNIFIDFDHMNRVRISEYPGEILLPTLEEIYPQYQFDRTEATYIEHDSDLLAPTVQKLELFGRALEDGTKVGYIDMDCTYYQTIDKRIASRLANDYIDSLKPLQIPLSDYELDIACAYQKGMGILIVILAHDTKMIYIESWNSPENEILQDPNEIVKAYLPMLQSNSK